ncbi:DUF4340 domain-containing protein [Nitrosococcus watsonii]|uniref:DUF4340 domain-containing protein n=1 Tax=Nitrosococcus watsoni (strain C-113) TaxID=105559 RepID=D8K4R4_NITWC|nr:DUF4340 domain-containing protein [Nitrosococcus watsonii]ADJ27891.1 conserved hypothetical protein [Nitrosococcus watsonii C-113]
MKKWIIILSGLLLAQLVLAVAVNLMSEDYNAFEPQESLLAFDVKAVEGLQIEDGQNSLVLKQQDDQWRLPESGDFPADQDAVERLLDELAGLERGWPVATTPEAAKRFKVDKNAFERKLTLLGKDESEVVLYVGTSPGFRKVHVRPAGEEAVYAVVFNTWEANAKASDWIDKDILKLDANQVIRLEMPDFVLERDGEVLKVADLGAEEETKEEEARALVDKLADLRIQSLLDSEVESEYQQAEPELEIKLVRESGDPLIYRFFKSEEEAYYLLKRSDWEPYFKVAAFVLEPIKEIGRENLVQAKTEETPKETAESNASAEAGMVTPEVKE